MRPVRVRSRRWLVLAAIVIAHALLSFFVSNSYYQLMLTLVPVWAIFALAWNLFSGYSGLLSFGHAAFFGIGAYTVTLGAAELALTPWIGIPVGGVLGAVAAFGIGVLTFRLRGHYFALAMLAYPLAILYVLEWARLTEVAFPMRRDAPILFMQFENPRIYTFLALGLALAAFILCSTIERSVFGISLRATGENEAAAEAAGINTFEARLKAIVASGALSAVAGGFYSVILLVVTPSAVFGLLTSAQPMIMTMFGGLGTVWGPIIGASILVPLSETLRAELGSVIPGIQGIVFGATIIAVVLLAPEGIFWKIQERWRRPSTGSSQLAPGSPPRAASPRPERTAPQGEPLLEARGVSKSFGGLRAVTDVSFSVNQGEILGIIGPNGAGKTTLFNMLSGFLAPTQGEFLLESRSIAGLKPNAVCRLGVGRTFQVVRAFPRMSLVENVVVGAFYAAATHADAERAALEAIAQVGLSHRLHASMSELTNNELRLMELARAIAPRPKVVLMDEPLAGLGRGEAEEFLSLIQELARQGLTVVIIEHTMHVMVRLVDRLLVLDHGQIIAEGPPDRVLNEPAVAEAYLGKKWGRRAEARIA